MSNSRYLIRHLALYYKTLSFIFLCLIIETIFYSAVPFSFKFIIDGALLGKNKDLLILILSLLGGGAIVAALLSISRDYLYAKIVAKIIRDLRQEIFVHLQRLSENYYSRTKVGDILAYFSIDLNAIENTALTTISWAILPLLGFISNFILLIILSWKLTAIAIVAWPIVLLGPQKLSAAIGSENYKKLTQESALLSVAQENIVMHKIIKAFRLFSYVKGRFVTSNNRLAASAARVNFLSAMVTTSGEMTAMFLQITVLAVGAYMVYLKHLTVGSLVSFQAIFTTLTYSLANMTQYFPTLVRSFTGIGRIREFLNERPGANTERRSTKITNFSDKIEFNRVTFSYDDESTHLNEVSFEIACGKSIAFVGSSGSGKSTILNLIMRFYDPLSGSILLDGINLREISEDSLRSLMSAVFQENFLFNLSIRDNIRMGKLDASNEEIEAAAKLAEIHDYIVSMPQSYDTVTGEKGEMLSGGQRQRIAIARAIVGAPPILLLDEATSALDPIVESAINATLLALSKGRTVITVTHRLDSVVHADTIFVLAQGKICEQGKHEALLARNGLYKSLWDKQHGFTINAEQDDATLTVERLRVIPLFEHLSKAFLEKSVTLFRTLLYPENQVVIREGDKGDLFYLIVRGRAAVFKTTQEGREQRVAVLEDGDHFGEVALLKSIPRTATVKTLTPCIFLTLKHRDFINLLKTAPELLKKLEAIIEARMVQQENIVI